MELKLVNAVMLGRYLSRGNTVLCSWVFVCKQLLAIQPPSKPVQNNLYQLRYSFFSMLCAVFRNKAFLFLFLFLIRKKVSCGNGGLRGCEKAWLPYRKESVTYGPTQLWRLKQTLTIWTYPFMEVATNTKNMDLPIYGGCNKH